MKFQTTIILILSFVVIFIYCAALFTLWQYEITLNQNRPLFDAQEGIYILTTQNRALQQQVTALTHDRDRWKDLAEARKQQWDGFSRLMEEKYDFEGHQQGYMGRVRE
jgi:cell division protein FtsL